MEYQNNRYHVNIFVHAFKDVFKNSNKELFLELGSECLHVHFYKWCPLSSHSNAFCNTN